MSSTRTRTASPATSLGHNSIDKTKLKEIISRIENIEEERSELASDVRSIYAEAKSSGFDVAALRQIIKMRKQDAEKRDARQAIVDEYLAALGDYGTTPLGQSAIARASQLMPPV
jgi:uncharacterized protein (UPF0335 family)